MTWLAKAWRWLVAVAIAVPALAALFLWGQRWRERAKSAERAREAAWEAAKAAQTRATAEAELADRERAAREALAHHLEARLTQIDEFEAKVAAAEPGAGRLNKAFGLGEGDEL